MIKISLGSDLERPYRVLLFCRCSYRISENGAAAAERELDRQEARLRDWVRCNIDVEVEIGIARMVDDCRPPQTIHEQLSKSIASGNWNLVLVTGLERVSQFVYVYDFLRIVADEQTRIIAVSNGRESGEPGWLFATSLAALRQEIERVERIHRIRRRRYAQVNDLHHIFNSMNLGN